MEKEKLIDILNLQIMSANDQLIKLYDTIELVKTSINNWVQTIDALKNEELTSNEKLVYNQAIDDCIANVKIKGRTVHTDKDLGSSEDVYVSRMNSDDEYYTIDWDTLHNLKKEVDETEI